MLQYGLKEKECQMLLDMFAANRHIEQVVLFGSRAMGNYKPFSDVDITLIGKELSHDDLIRLYTDVNESLLPYKFDISIFCKINNKDLIDHINRRGKVIYRRENDCVADDDRLSPDIKDD